MSKIKYFILTLGLIAGFGLVIVPSYASASGPNVLDPACAGTEAAKSPICKDRNKDKVPAFVKTLVNVLLYVLGAVSVIVIVISGFFYATSGGDAALITKSKNTLLYAVVGLIVALLAYAVVNFVITAFAP